MRVDTVDVMAVSQLEDTFDSNVGGGAAVSKFERHRPVDATARERPTDDRKLDRRTVLDADRLPTGNHRRGGVWVNGSTA